MTDYYAKYLRYYYKNMHGGGDDGNDEAEPDFPCSICLQEITIPMSFKGSSDGCETHVFCVECLYEYVRHRHQISTFNGIAKCPLDRKTYRLSSQDPNAILECIEINQIVNGQLDQDENIECKICVALRLENTMHKRSLFLAHWRHEHFGKDTHLVSFIGASEPVSQSIVSENSMLPDEMQTEEFRRQQLIIQTRIEEETRSRRAFIERVQNVENARGERERINAEIRVILQRYPAIDENSGIRMRRSMINDMSRDFSLIPNVGPFIQSLIQPILRIARIILERHIDIEINDIKQEILSGNSELSPPIIDNIIARISSIPDITQEKIEHEAKNLKNSLELQISVQIANIRSGYDFLSESNIREITGFKFFRF